MVKGLYTAYTGMMQEQRRLDSLSNNLANSTNAGFKKEGITSRAFDRELAIRIKDTGTITPKHIGTLHLGVKAGESYTDWSQGPMQITDKPSDLAITGQGFFAIEYTDKEGYTSIKYTRNGEFTVDRDGYVRTVDGDYLLNQAGAANSQSGEQFRVRVTPTQDYGISANGTIFQNGAAVDQIGVVDIEDYDFIEKYGENLYDLVEGGNVIASTASVEQGALEMSNVNVVDEMVDMITVQRAYEANQRMLRTEDEALEMSVGQVGSVS